MSELRMNWDTLKRRCRENVRERKESGQFEVEEQRKCPNERRIGTVWGGRGVKMSRKEGNRDILG